GNSPREIAMAPPPASAPSESSAPSAPSVVASATAAPAPTEPPAPPAAAVAPALSPSPSPPSEESSQMRTAAIVALPPPRLIGRDRAGVAAELGAPAGERQVASARVWDYRAAGCQLAVFFYLDTGRNDFYALHVEVDGAAPGTEAGQQCIQRIRD